MASGAGRQRILLVEDETMVAGMLHRMLTDLGYLVVGPAADVNEAMAFIGDSNIDAVVLDINLDGEMSYPVADELSARGIPFVFSTGYGSDNLSEDYNPAVLLKKPFRRSVLGGAISRMLLARQERATASARERS
jgi:DNA-binding NtrC family response regulator